MTLSYEPLRQLLAASVDARIEAACIIYLKALGARARTMGKRTRTIILLLSIAALIIPSLACLGGGDDWDGLDRSGWAWDGSAGDDPIATAVAIGQEAADVP